jgi:hypothetical protein
MVLVRRAECELCGGFWYMAPGEKVPKACKFCTSRFWEFGLESIASRKIRGGQKIREKVLDRVTLSRVHRDLGRKQWRGFKSKEEYEAIQRDKALVNQSEPAEN